MNTGRHESGPLSEIPKGLRTVADIIDGGMSEDGLSMDLDDKGYAAGFRDDLIRWADALQAGPPDGLSDVPDRLRQLSRLFDRLSEKGSLSMPSSAGKETEVQDDLRFWAVLIEAIENIPG